MMNIYKQIPFLFFMFFIFHNSNAAVYKCKQPDGKVTFQDKHCPEDAAAEVVSSSHQTLCYTLTGTDRSTLQIANFWTQQEKTERFIAVQINQKKAVFAAGQIESISLIETKDNCAMTKLVNNERQSFDALLCEDIYYTSEKGEGSFPLAQLTSIQSCQSKINADGSWSFNGKKYPVQSAYASYSKTSHQLKVTLFPFMLNKTEEETLLKGANVESILINKPENLALGIIFQLRPNVSDPQITDVVQFQTFVANNQTTSVRSYDQNWQRALTLKQFHIVKSKQGNTAQISWTLTDRNQQANINVSAIVIGDKF